MVIRAVQAAILLGFGYVLYRSAVTGEHVMVPLAVWLLIMLVGIQRLAFIRQQFQTNDTERKRFQHMVIRGIVIGVGIVLILAAATFWYGFSRS